MLKQIDININNRNKQEEHHEKLASRCGPEGPGHRRAAAEVQPAGGGARSAGASGEL